MPKASKSKKSLSWYLVCCEFNEDDEYDDFYEALNEYDAWQRVFPGGADNFFVLSEDSAEDIYRNLFDNMFEGDFVFVCEVGSEYALYLDEDAVDWIEENVN